MHMYVLLITHSRPAALAFSAAPLALAAAALAALTAALAAAAALPLSVWCVSD